MVQAKRIYLYLSVPLGGRQKFTLGTFEDLAANHIEPREGLRLHFYCDDANPSTGERDDLLFEGVIGFDANLGWHAIVDEGAVRSQSELNSGEGIREERDKFD